MYYNTFRQTHDEFMGLLKDQKEMFDYVGVIEVQVIKTTSTLLHSANVKRLKERKAKIADADFAKELRERMHA